MYFYQLQKGMDEIPPTDVEIRQQMTAQGEAQGWASMHAWLNTVDPITAARLKPNDKQRISRALEIYVQTGTPLSVWHTTQEKKGSTYAFSNRILAPQDRAIIHDRIEKRFDLMLAQGFLEEVDTLYKRGDLNPSMPSIRCVGYRQAWDYLAGLCDKKTMREKAIIATRQLCKRQFTWLRRWENGLLK